LEKSKHSISKKQLKLKCKVDNPDARVKWYKDGVEVNVQMIPKPTLFIVKVLPVLGKGIFGSLHR
jgi:hypothetical protein